jgi:hypothetical protein
MGPGRCPGPARPQNAIQLETCRTAAVTAGPPSEAASCKRDQPDQPGMPAAGPPACHAASRPGESPSRTCAEATELNTADLNRAPRGKVECARVPVPLASAETRSGPPQAAPWAPNPVCTPGQRRRVQKPTLRCKSCIGQVRVGYCMKAARERAALNIILASSISRPKIRCKNAFTT